MLTKLSSILIENSLHVPVKKMYHDDSNSDIRKRFIFIYETGPVELTSEQISRALIWKHRFTVFESKRELRRLSLENRMTN